MSSTEFESNNQANALAAAPQIQNAGDPGLGDSAVSRAVPVVSKPGSAIQQGEPGQKPPLPEI